MNKVWLGINQNATKYEKDDIVIGIDARQPCLGGGYTCAVVIAVSALRAEELLRAFEPEYDKQYSDNWGKSAEGAWEGADKPWEWEQVGCASGRNERVCVLAYGQY